MPWGSIKGIIRNSLIDYPGKISAVLFLGGCNYRCPFCYNSDLVLRPHELPSIPKEELVQFLESRKEWLDGIVISGGEPTLCPKLTELLELIKGMGYAVKIDTNGSNPAILDRLISRGLVDYVAVDIKSPLFPDRYQIFTQANDGVGQVKHTVEMLMSSDIEYEFRTTIVPEIIKPQDILQIAQQLKGAKRYYLQQFKPSKSTLDPYYSTLPPYPLELLYQLRDKISGFFRICRVRP